MTLPLAMQTMTDSDRLRAILRHWQRVVLDPQTKVPTTFALLMDAALQAQTAEENAYAERVRRIEQRERLEGRADEDSERVMEVMRGRT